VGQRRWCKLYASENRHKVDQVPAGKEERKMHEVLRQRLLRRIESLPEAQVYQVLDFVEFLESKYARDARLEPTVLQKFAEGVEDTLRKQAMNPAKLREAFQLIAAADRVLGDVADAGKQILGELSGEPAPRRNLSREGGASGGGATGGGVSPGSRRGPPGPVRKGEADDPKPESEETGPGS
jgi:hypothetical protein